ncbi:hypothetical protein SPD48_09700 [Pseudogracilibacillus sp. SE30717A]
MDKDIKRIEYYTRKVALYGNRETKKGKNKYRHQRLLDYKEALNNRLRNR